MATQSGVTYGINYIERNATGSTWGGAGCSSNATISGDGYVEFEAKTQTANVMMGLSFTSPNHHYNTIDYALYYITGDRLVVYESGSLKMTTTVTEGDLCRVMRVGNKIRYYRNSELLREVEETNPANMMADFTFYQSGARIYNPKIVDVAYQHGAQYIADVKSYSDFYSFGMLKPGRHGGESYRYNFQGQESDDEVKGKGNSVNYKYRMHDPRLGRFFATDPLESKYPHNSPFAFSENMVIHMIELEGLESARGYFNYSVDKFFGVNRNHHNPKGQEALNVLPNTFSAWQRYEKAHTANLSNQPGKLHIFLGGMTLVCIGGPVAVDVLPEVAATVTEGASALAPTSAGVTVNQSIWSQYGRAMAQNVIISYEINLISNLFAEDPKSVQSIFLETDVVDVLSGGFGKTIGPLIAAGVDVKLNGETVTLIDDKSLKDVAIDLGLDVVGLKTAEILEKINVKVENTNFNWSKLFKLGDEAIETVTTVEKNELKKVTEEEKK
jgi:RHS repeat-associated protein